MAAVDGSDRTHTVVRVAGKLASLYGASLVLLRVVPHTFGTPSQVVTQDASETSMRMRMQDATAALERLRGELPQSLAIEVRVAAGTPWREICRAASNVSADLLVIGAHRYSSLERMLGTTAASVVNHAPCSVLLAREPRLFESDVPPT